MGYKYNEPTENYTVKIPSRIKALMVLDKELKDRVQAGTQALIEKIYLDHKGEHDADLELLREELELKESEQNSSLKKIDRLRVDIQSLKEIIEKKELAKRQESLARRAKADKAGKTKVLKDNYEFVEWASRVDFDVVGKEAVVRMINSKYGVDASYDLIKEVALEVRS